jgi:hypothetical protein
MASADHTGVDLGGVSRAKGSGGRGPWAAHRISSGWGGGRDSSSPGPAKEGMITRTSIQMLGPVALASRRFPVPSVGSVD